ncbi:MAG: NusG domain II-containing protein [Lachnospiraceae bacterium]|nr:NusG domain II-containing protein [Lachnospiraceae bacterium]
MPTSNPSFFQNRTNRRAAFLMLLLSLLLAASAGCLLYGRYKAPKALYAHIYLQGELLTSIDLRTVTETYTFTVEIPEGGSNTIGVKPGAITVLDADCPDRLCVLTGYTDSTLLPIICLPHGLIIRLETAHDTTPDAISY